MFKLYSQQARDLGTYPSSATLARQSTDMQLGQVFKNIVFLELAFFITVYNLSFHNQERSIVYRCLATPVPFQLEIQVNSASRFHRP